MSSITTRESNRNAFPSHGKPLEVWVLHGDGLGEMLAQSIVSAGSEVGNLAVKVLRFSYGWRPCRKDLTGVDAVVSLLPDIRPARMAREMGIQVFNGLVELAADSIPQLVFDLPHVGRLAAERLLEVRMMDFAFVSPMFCRYSGSCMKGYVKALKDACREPVTCLLPCRFEPRDGTFRHEFVQTPFYEWFTLLRRPFGVFCTSQGIADLARAVTNEMKLYPNIDYRIVTVQDCADRPSAGAPGCDSIAFPMAAAATRLVEMVCGRTVPPRMECERLLPSVASGRVSAQDRALSSAMSYIASNVERTYSIETLAGHAGCSRRTLERLFRHTLGKSVLSVIQTSRIEAAKQFLLSEGMKVRAVARKVGYAAPAQFYAVFKKAVGMTPVAFRRLVTRP